MTRFDREAVLRNADKALKANKIDQAIAEYERVVEHQPKDVATANLLGDLYARAGRLDGAIAQYTRIAEQFVEDGFYPKASAQFKKILKLRPDDEGTLLRLGRLAARQRLLADARSYFLTVSARRRERGDAQGADDVLIELADAEGADADTRMQAARILAARGQRDAASARLREMAIELLEKERPEEAVDVLREAVHLMPDDRVTRRQLIGLLTDLDQADEAEVYLTRDAAAGDPAMLFTIAKAELEAGRLDEGREDLRAALADRGLFGSALAFMSQIAARHPDAAYVAADALMDSALGARDVDHALEAIRSFLDGVPSHVPAALRFVEICMEESLDDMLPLAQARLAAAYTAAGQHDLARQMSAEPIDEGKGQRAAGEGDERGGGKKEKQEAIDLGVQVPEFDVYVYGQPIEPEPVEPAKGPAEPGGPSEPVETEEQLIARLLAEEAAQEAMAVPEVLPEIDLTASLDSLDAGTAPDAPAPEAAEAPAGARPRIRDEEQQGAESAFEEAGLAAALGQAADAGRLYAEAAGFPPLRFRAAAALGRLLRDQGRLADAIEWFERAAEVPAPDRDAGHALLYDLGDALERHGESMRALAIFMELNADAGDYRGIAARVERLARAEIGG